MSRSSSPRRSSPLLAGLLLLAAAVAAEPPAAPGPRQDAGAGEGKEVAMPPMVVPEDVTEFFCLPDAESVFHLRLAPAPAATARLDVRLRGYDGAGEDAPAATVAFGTDGRGELRLRLPTGYHELVFDGAGAEGDPKGPAVLGVCCLPPAPETADGYFAIDTAMTWLETRPALRARLVAGLRRAGVRKVRERLSFGAVNPRPGEWNTGGERDAYSLRAEYARHGIAVLEIFHGVPGWMGPDRRSPLPQDLSRLAADFATMPPELTATCRALEVWNEPDLLRVPGDQYATVVRAAAYAMRRAHPDIALVTGVFALDDPGAFAEVCAANGMVELSDAISVHNYNRAPLLARSVAAYGALCAAHGRPGMPYWLTESGLPWTIGTPRPRPDEARECALEIAAKAVEGRAAGIAEYYPFVYPYYEEGGVHNFAMLGREATPLRAMAVYAQCVRALSGAGFLGDLQLDDPAVVCSRMFRVPGEQELLWTVYSGKAGGMALRCPGWLAAAARRARGIDGRELPLPTADGEWRLPDGLAYVYLDPAVASRARPVERPAAPAAKASPTAPAPVFAHFRFAAAPVTPAANYYLVAPERAAGFRLPLRLFNLSPEPRTESFVVRLPSGRALPARSFAVPAEGYLDAEWEVDLRGELSPARARFLRVAPAGELAPDAAAARTLAVPLLLQAELADHLREHAAAIPLPVREAERWRPNIVGHGRMTMEAAADGMRLGFAFTRPGQRWAYPHFVLPRPVGELLPGAKGFVVRGRSAGGGRNVFMWAVDADGPFMSGELFPADGKWHVCFVPFGEFSPAPQHPQRQNAQFAPATVHTLYLGMMSDDAENVLTVSDLYLVGD